MNLPQAIADELAAIEKQKQEILALSDVAAMGHQMAAQFESLAIRVSIVRRVASPPFVCLMCDVLAFKDCVPVLQELAKHGWHTHKACPFEDYHELDRRTYNLCERDEFPVVIDPKDGSIVQEESWRFGFRLRLMTFLKSDGVCRRVQVGTKQEPVYEFVCE